MNVTLRETKAKLSEYVERASGGEEVIITVRGRPKARLCPADAAPHFSGTEFVCELKDVQSRYRVKKGTSDSLAKTVSDLREERQ